MLEFLYSENNVLQTISKDMPQLLYKILDINRLDTEYKIIEKYFKAHGNNRKIKILYRFKKYLIVSKIKEEVKKDEK